jgi:hypothetical protein
MNSFQTFWHSCLWEGTIIGTDLQDWPEDVVTQVLHAAYLEHARDHGDRHPIDDVRMAAALDAMMPANVLGRRAAKRIRPRKRYGDQDRPPRYALPPLEACRKSFLEIMKITTKYPWPEIEEHT